MEEYQTTDQKLQELHAQTIVLVKRLESKKMYAQAKQVYLDFLTIRDTLTLYEKVVTQIEELAISLKMMFTKSGGGVS